MGSGERHGYATDLECIFVRPHANIHMYLISGGFSRGLFYNTKLISSKKNTKKLRSFYKQITQGQQPEVSLPLCSHVSLWSTWKHWIKENHLDGLGSQILHVPPPPGSPPWTQSVRYPSSGFLSHTLILLHSSLSPISPWIREQNQAFRVLCAWCIVGAE